MNIGEAAAAAGLSPRMVRHYEKIGLTPKALRRDSQYRDYSTSDVHRLRFIARARDLGFPIDEIAGALERPDACKRRRQSAGDGQNCRPPGARKGAARHAAFA